MFRRIAFLRFLALIASFAGLVSVCAASAYARGDVHIVLVVSTADPDLQELGEIWKYRLEGALFGGLDERYLDALDADLTPNYGALDKDKVKTYKVLTGADANPDNILKVCRAVSETADADDAVAVFILSHGGIENSSHFLLFPQKDVTLQKDVFLAIDRKWIMEAIQSPRRRLNVLITDSCSKPVLFSPPRGRACKSVAPLPILPKKDCYLKRFLTEAEGELNINSSGDGEIAEFWNGKVSYEFEQKFWGGRFPSDYFGPLSPLMGTRFSNAFVKFATSQYYLDAELNTDDFYRLLSLELDKEVEDFNGAMLDQRMGRHDCKQTLTSFGNDRRSMESRHFTFDDYNRIKNERIKKMAESGEFEKNPAAEAR